MIRKKHSAFKLKRNSLKSLLLYLGIFNILQKLGKMS